MQWLHDILMMYMKLSNIAMLNINDSDYRCVITEISKSRDINLMQNVDVSENFGKL